MESLNNKLKLYIVDNFGYTRSDEITSTVVYYCFINNCQFETTNIGELIGHSDAYKEHWFGFCFKCNAQIYDKKVSLTTELLHMTQCHKFYNNGIGITIDQLSQDNKIEIQNALNTARAERLERSCEVSLTPWRKPTRKTRNSGRKMLKTLSCLYALYKCMEINCTFSTECAENMLTHLQDHESHSASKMDNPSKVSSWLDCAYCDLTSDSCFALVQHTWVEHSASLYQCPYCFYRSSAAFNVVFHLRQFHQSLERSVLVCNGKQMDFAAEKTGIEQYRSKNVRPLRCSEACKRTYVMDHFINHMKTSTEHSDNFKCQFCGSKVLISEATKHLLCHNIGVYQCIYCIYGTNTLDSMQNHMCNTHPNRLLYICVRLTRKNRILSDEELSSVESTILSQLGAPVDSNLLKIIPFTEEKSSGNVSDLTAASPNSRLPIMSTNISNNLSSLGQPAFNDILDFNELQKEYTSADWNEYFADFAAQFPSPMVDGSSEMAVDAPEAVHNLVQEDVLQSEIDCESIQLDDRTCNNTASMQSNETEESHLPAVEGTADCDNAAALVPAEPIQSKSIVIVSDDKKDVKTTKSKKKPVNRKKARNGNVTSAEDMQQKNKHLTQFKKPKLSDIVKYKCIYCPKCCDNLGKTYEHWKTNHLDPSAFMFEIAKIFLCYYCRQCDTYDKLRSHCESKHRKQVFAMIDKMNPKKCGLCLHQFNDVGQEIYDHFEECHNAKKDITIKLEDYLTDELLDRMIAENCPQNGKRTSQIMYGCSNPQCTEMNCEQDETVAHIRKEYLKFQCNYCDAELKKKSLIKEHHKKAHDKDDKTYRFNDVRKNLTVYLDMKIIFPNGLLLTKRDCKNTRFGAMNEVIRKVEEINGERTRRHLKPK